MSHTHTITIQCYRSQMTISCQNQCDPVHPICVSVHNLIYMIKNTIILTEDDFILKTTNIVFV